MRAARAEAVRACGARLALHVAVLLGAVSPAGTAHAHGGGDARVRTMLEASLPAELDGMRVEAHRTVAPQLVIENPTARVLEVLDADGVAFLRIGPDGVEANLAARAWFQTAGPGAPVPPALASERSPRRAARWVRVARGHAFGWFEPRLDASDVHVADAVRSAARPADVGRWRVPLRVDGAPVALEGRFRWEPPPAGAYRARLASPRALAPGVRVRLLPGPAPGLLIENTGRGVVTVLDADGSPFLRIGRKGVEANVRSAGWAASGRRGTLAAAGGGPSRMRLPHWRRVSRASSYGWIDPRLMPDDPFAARIAWQIPVLVGATAHAVEGASEWRVPASHTAAISSSRILREAMPRKPSPPV